MNIMTHLKYLFLFAIYFQTNLAFMNVYPKLKTYKLKKGDDPGIPLFLTPLIESGKIEEARNKSTVQHKEMNDITSYSGYFTVNKKYNSNLFFWFFPAQIDPKAAPVVLWLQGGPGATSLFGLFEENGPFYVTKNKTLKMRKYSWNVNHNLIYIDNPVGTGYSFTDNDEGYAKNETDVGRDVYTALNQFFHLFPEFQQNDFYVTGESYAGKYVPAVSHAIKDFNIKAKMKINLKGLSIGNGLTDPLNQLIYSDYLYQIGLVDFNGKDQLKKIEDKARQLIIEKKYAEAFEVFDALINSDLDNSQSYFTNLTGYNFYFNYLITNNSDDDSDNLSQWIQRVDVRRAINVGNCSFNVESKVVEAHLKEDILQSAAYIVADLLQHYKVLIYNGQLDIIVAYPLTENYLMNLNWPGASDYKKALRKQWWVGKELAGYAKVAQNLTEVLVRKAGHMVPADQPKWAWDLITRFTHNKSI